MREVAFTIVAKNYYGLALVLRKSFLSFNPNFDFKIFIADELDVDKKLDLDLNTLISRNALDIPKELWAEMSFKYDLTEFCTSIKPTCFKYLISKGYSKLYYFDPDILFFNSIDSISQVLNTYDIVLTPHQLVMEKEYTGDISEKNLLGTGVFNLGFCGIRNSDTSLNMLDWWEERLKKLCFSEPLDFLFTDQKIIDLLPALMSANQLYISRDLGLNVAPWNFSEREVLQLDNKFMVRERNKPESLNYDLTFVHYSGYDYKLLIKGENRQNNIETIKTYDDILTILECYKMQILDAKEIFSMSIELNYSYNNFNNGVPILKFHRRLYNGWVNRDQYRENPFDISLSFYCLLKKHKMLTKPQGLDNLTVKNINNPNRKIASSRLFFRIMLKVIGIRRYIVIVKLFRYFAKFERHIFLLD